jgi:hypothetical protein
MHKKEIAGSIVRATARPEADPDDPRKWLWVEASVWANRMLAALGNGVRGGKWHSFAGQMPSSLYTGFSPCTKPMFWRASPDEGNYRLESCVRENRTHRSEGGEDGSPSRPLSMAENSLLHRNNSTPLRDDRSSQHNRQFP